MKTGQYYGMWAFYLLLLGIISGCHREPPEQRLRHTIAEMQTAIEQGEPRKFMAYVSNDFIGNDSLDHAGLAQLLRGQLLLNAKVGIQTGPISIEMPQKDTATVRFTVLLTGSGGSFLPERGQMQQVTSGWRESDGQWQLYSAQWHPIAGG